jgi:hypothetical protein
MSIPMTSSSANLWGIVLGVNATAFYSGNEEAILAQALLPRFELVAQGDANFTLDLVAPEASASQAANVIDYFVSRCGAVGTEPWAAGSWSTDLHVRLRLPFDYLVDFWVRDLELPCHTTSPVAPFSVAGNQTQEGGENEGCTEGPEGGKYCITFLCAIDDLLCERTCPAHDRDAVASSSPAAAPLAPPPAAPVPVPGGLDLTTPPSMPPNPLLPPITLPIG